MMSGLVEFAALLVGDYTLRTVALGAAVLGVVGGALGSFAVLRKQSLLGDAMSHAALPGIALAFLLTGSKAPLILLVGAALAGWIGTLAVMSIIRHSRIKQDSALGIVLSVFFGFGLVLLTLIQRLPDANQAGLDKFLFGQAATLLGSDVVIMASLGLPALAVLVLFWKEFKLLSFDGDFGSSLGFPMRLLDTLLTALLVIAIVIGLQTVGVVLMSAMIVAPAVAARQWTDRLGVMVMLSALFGAFSGVAGALISSSTFHMPTGPTIVLVISSIAVASLLVAPNRGLLWGVIRRSRNNRRLQVRAILEDLYMLAETHEDPHHAHPISVLRTMSIGHGGVDRSLDELVRMGWAARVSGEGWALTDAGFTEAGRLFKGEGQNDDRTAD